jgi:hypothetical protein
MAFRADARLIFTSTTDVLPSGCGEINAFAAPFHAKKAISLPRQARDKHRESTQKRRERRFFRRGRGTLAVERPLSYREGNSNTQKLSHFSQFSLVVHEQ